MELKRQIAALTKERDDQILLHDIALEHRNFGPKDGCGCVSCNLHLIYRHKLTAAEDRVKALEAAGAKMATVLRTYSEPQIDEVAEWDAAVKGGTE